MNICYECEKEVNRIVWNSRCQECVGRRVRVNLKCLEVGCCTEEATEELAELRKYTNIKC